MRIIRAAERSESDVQREVAACVRAGGTLIFPTETVYGLGCDPDNDTAIDAIFALKGRSASKPLALHVADRAQAAPFCAALTQCARDAMERLWPGPVAIVVQRRADRYARAACSFTTISLRCPDHDVCHALLRAAGPLAATSANISAREPYTGDSDDLAELPRATLALLAGPTRLRTESSIVDCTGETPVVIRVGAVPVAVIQEKLGTPIPLR